MSAGDVPNSLQGSEFDDGGANLGRWLIKALHTERALVARMLEQRHQVIAADLEVQLRRARLNLVGLSAAEWQAPPSDQVPKVSSVQVTPAPAAEDGLVNSEESASGLMTAAIALALGTDAQASEKDDVNNSSDLPVSAPSLRASMSKSKASFDEFWKEAMPRDGSAHHHGFLAQGTMDLGPNANWATRLVIDRRFEIVFGILIVFNTLISTLQVQYEGLQTDFEVNYTSSVVHRGEVLPAARVWPFAEECFNGFEIFFGVVFTLELLAKVCSFQRRILFNAWNVFDGVLIALWLLSSGLQVELLMNPMVLRVCRMARLFRLMRLLKTITLFDSLHLLISSIKASLSVLIWSAVLLVFVMVVVSLVLNAQLIFYVRGDEGPLDKRQEVYKYFGSFTRSMLTMFEITLGNWVPVCRLLLEHVHEGYAAFFVLYKVVVGFGCVKVITAVFMHETFKVAAADNALMVIQRERTVREHKDKMHSLFHETDMSQDGYLAIDEFATVLKDPWVKTWLAAMELTVQDVNVLFDTLAQGDGRISPSELVTGVARLKGPARSLDMVTILSAMDREQKAAFAELRMNLEAVNERIRDRSNVEAMISEIRSILLGPRVQIEV